MQQEYGKMMKEQQRLEEVRRELAQLSEPTRRDVEIIRERLEKADRDLAWCRRDHDVKKKAYETALEVMEKKDKEKQALADHLRLIIHESEKRKTAKLEELMAKLGFDSGSAAEGFQGF
mmetsp:Transcript_76728/g.115459  ORF Transcript_76728/g.115459 Transcript_76728/m.115459 type:complete len:119 (-) Transcript_76728:22-378(-)